MAGHSGIADSFYAAEPAQVVRPVAGNTAAVRRVTREAAVCVKPFARSREKGYLCSFCYLAGGFLRYSTAPVLPVSALIFSSTAC